MHRSLHVRSLPRHEWTVVPSLKVKLHARWDSAGVPNETLLLIAGLGVSSGHWVPLGRRLASWYRVFAPDLPGFGQHQNRPMWRGRAVPIHESRRTSCSRGWMQCGLQRVSLCGHSNGCQTVADFSRAFSHRVNRLILASPTYEQRHRTLGYQLPRLLLATFFEKLRVDPSHPDWRIHRCRNPPCAEQATRTIPFPLEKKLRAVVVPTLVIRGEWDTVVSQRYGPRGGRVAASGDAREVARVGHGVHYSSASVMATVIHRFLSGELQTNDPPLHGTIVAAADDPRRDPRSPYQPISPAAHDLFGSLLATAALTMPTVLGWSRRPTRVWNIVGGLTAVSHLLAGKGRMFPMLTRIIGDILVGLILVFAAVFHLRRESRLIRWSTAALGLSHIAAATLTAKPTGPGTVCEVSCHNPSA